MLVVLNLRSRNDPGHSLYTGEIGRLGYRVSEQYLDDRARLSANVNRLKMLSRCRALPLMARIGRERRWPQMACICLACGTAEVEDNEHFFLRCPFYNDLRSSLFDSIQHMSHNQGFIGIVFVNFNGLSGIQQLEIVLGKRIGNAAVERGIDTAVKIFLEAAWTRRSDIRERINVILSRTDS